MGCTGRVGREYQGIRARDGTITDDAAQFSEQKVSLVFVPGRVYQMHEERLVSSMQERGTCSSKLSTSPSSSSRSLSTFLSIQLPSSSTFLGRPARAKQDWQSVGHTSSHRP